MNEPVAPVMTMCGFGRSDVVSFLVSFSEK
jgi:hypothetical protein